MKYDKLNQNDSFEHDLNWQLCLICCDCGLVHRYDIRQVSKRKIKITVRRDDRATNLHRKQHVSEMKDLVKNITAVIKKNMEKKYESGNSRKPKD
jgi:hypothetical protein